MAFSYDRLKSPAFFAENRLAPHSDHAWYPSRADRAAEENPLKLSLGGYWHFAYARNEGLVPIGFEADSFDCHSWEYITVPAHIQMEGHDVPQYVNAQYPWDGWQDVVPGEIPNNFNPVACYVKYFTLPAEMAEKQVFLSFQGVESCVAVWLNGQYVGFSSNSFSPCEFELTTFLRPGENKLAARVYKWCAGSWLEDQDFFRFSGIYREVYLYAVPEQHIQDLKVVPSLDETLTEGTIAVSGTILGKGGWKIRLTLDGKPLGVLEDNRSTFSGVFTLDEPQLWSAEKPNLYQLELELLGADGALREIVPQPVGFRRFEIKNGLMTLNGKRIVFKGVNRHDFSADVGRAVTAEHIRRDLETMKRNNINALRTCHYPDSQLVYTLCDQLGLYVIAENNMETHGAWGWINHHPYGDSLPGDRMEWEPVLLDRVEATYQTAKNHPSVLIWSLGNESGGGTVIRDMALRFRALDNTRLIHYEGVCREREYAAECSDMESQMYTPAAKIQEFLHTHPEKPFLCCEYTHSMGNSNGGMDRYTDLTETEPRYQGGFIWDFIDQAIQGKDRYGQTAYFYGGDFGDRPSDYAFSGNGICYADGTETPKMPAVKFNYQNITAKVEPDRVTVINKNLFTSTSEYDCRVAVYRDGKPWRNAALPTDVAPLTEKTYPLPFPQETHPGEYAITVSFHLHTDTAWAKAGHEVAFGQGVYQVAAPARATTSLPFRVIRGCYNTSVVGDGFGVLFSNESGGLVSYKYGGVEMLRAIPQPNFWRPMVENDLGALIEQKVAQWKIGSQFIGSRNACYMSIEPTIEVQNGVLTATYTYYMPTAPASSCQVAYTVSGDGTVSCHLAYTPVPGLPPMPEFGMLFKMDADFDRLTWYGNGPGESYCDRLGGTRLGIWSSTVRQQMANYLRPQESGNHTGVRWAKVTNYRGQGLVFSSDGGDGMEFSVLPWTPHEIDCAQHPYELPPVHNTVIRCAWKQMGVGGDNTWGSIPHPEYWLETDRPLSFRFSFKGCVGIDTPHA